MKQYQIYGMGVVDMDVSITLVIAALGDDIATMGKDYNDVKHTEKTLEQTVKSKRVSSDSK